jgi:hypothetical protein
VVELWNGNFAPGAEAEPPVSAFPGGAWEREQATDFEFPSGLHL